MRFVPVPGAPLFSVWETRVQDFRAFAADTGFKPGSVFTLRVERNKGGYDTAWKIDEKASWEKPGIEQGPTHPVVGVSWHDAKRFCAWLTHRERAFGLIGPADTYRLPTDAEWSQAAGSATYPWGEEPPGRLPRGAGNYADESLRKTFPGWGWPRMMRKDGYAYTAPVGSFAANAFGIHDLGGNAFEWVEDEYRADMNDEKTLRAFPGLSKERSDDGTRYRTFRGASWSSCDPLIMRSAHRNPGHPRDRGTNRGFRIVLDLSGR